MLVLLGIGLLAGAITAISPCVLPVLPILLAGGAAGSKRRPYAIVAGLVASFTLFTLFAAWILGRLGLPQSTLRDVALGFLFLLAATLLVPPLGTLLERPFLPLTRRRGGDLGGGFLLGASLGLVFVPCAGPVLAAVTVVAATQKVDGRTAALTAAYALGAAVPMLAVAAGGRAAAARIRGSAARVRAGAGVLVAAAAVTIALGLDTRLQTALPGYTDALQARVESHAVAALHEQALPTYGKAPDFAGIQLWLNSKPLTLRQLRGKVVLVDFWTYSCINCLRTLPHLEAWDAAYRKRGLVIVGVHTPEFAFEHVPANVEAAVRRYHVRYPVALDNDYATWNAWHNLYWPAEFLIDKRGRIRHAHFGEGDYGGTESAIRQLLGERGPRAAAVRDATPREETTPESYLGYARLARYEGSPIVRDRFAAYRAASIGTNELTYAGRWKVGSQQLLAGPGAELRLRFRARDVYLVLGGRGTVTSRIGGGAAHTIRVAGDRLYTIRSGRRLLASQLDLRFTPGVSAYAFTFG
ncbi:MAG TPA: redoxin domain-containing protein [Gaiellaceae bacterium]|nr:redoxin domain-containing protein [Gaiellaceae bacterium]